MAAAVKAFAKKQIEFYFCDSNLPKDRFLLGEANKDEDKDGEGRGWVALELLCSFSRMSQKKGDMGEADFVALVAEALEPSATVELNDAKDKIRRKEPLPGKIDQAVLDKSAIYAKGFPAVGTTLDEILEFCSGAGLGTVKAVRMRYTYDKPRKFKGSVFVELANEAEATAAIAKELEYEGKPLILRPKPEYLAEKRKEYEERRAKKESGGAASPAAGGTGKADFSEKEYPKGTSLKVEGMGEGCSREDVKAAFAECGAIEWVLYQRGEPDGFVFFKEAGQAAKTVEKLFVEGVPELGGKKPTLTALEGDEEKGKWHEVWTVQASFQQKRKSHDGGRGGRGNKRQRS